MSKEITQKHLDAWERVKGQGWLPVFQREAKRIGMSTAHLLGHGWVETKLRNIRGDFRDGNYHGFGILQVDIGTDAAYCRTWTPQNWERGIVRGADIALQKARRLQQIAGRPGLVVKGHRYDGRAIDREDFRRIVTAMYNNGDWPYYAWSQGRNIDSYTAHAIYSRDVYDAAIVFAMLLEQEGVEPGALRQEVVLQGKYARDRHQRLVGVPESGDHRDEIEQGDEIPGAVVGIAPGTQDTQPSSQPAMAGPVVVSEPVRPVGLPDEADRSLLAGFQRVKVLVVTLCTGLGAWGAKIGNKFASLTEDQLTILIATVCLLGLGYLIIHYVRKEKREQRAHQLTLIQAQTAARRDQNAVVFSRPA